MKFSEKYTNSLEKQSKPEKEEGKTEISIEMYALLEKLEDIQKLLVRIIK